MNGEACAAIMELLHYSQELFLMDNLQPVGNCFSLFLPGNKLKKLTICKKYNKNKEIWCLIPSYNKKAHHLEHFESDGKKSLS